MQKILYGLIELQEVDKRLDELRSERGDLPLIVEELKSKLDAKKSESDQCKEEIKDGKVKQRELELKIDELKAKYDKYEDQLYQVKTNREYDAITQETETVKQQLEDAKKELEDIQLSIIENESKQKEIGEDLKKLEEEYEDNTVELNTKMNETAEEENLLQQERDIIIKKSNPDIIKTYELVRQARSGQGIARIEGNVCGGCYSRIPPQKIVEVKKMKEIYTCEFCGRILVWNES
ncbi:MAG: C4-type zinc ribbon domain-containing protein [Calditrichaceae bacterium]